MNPLTLEWIQKAEGDYTIMLQNYQSSTPVYDGICFPCPTVHRKVSKGVASRGRHPFFKNT